jgi:hypothetical protein
MACSPVFFTLTLLLAQPAPEAQPAPAAVTTPAPVASPQPVATAPAPTGSAAPYELELSEAEIKRPEATYRLTARRWREMVREDPHLWHLHKRGRLVIPGAIFLSVSGVWLSISTAVYLDTRSDGYRQSATENLFQWVLPSAMFAAGAIMTYVGAKARRDLRLQQQKLYVAPYASAGQGGLSLSGRF